MLKRAGKRPKATSIERKEAKTAYLCLIPAFLGLSVLTYIPLVVVFILSFFQWKGLSAPVFNGGENYVRLFTVDPYFKDSIVVTVWFSVIAVIGGMVYSLIVAMLLNRKIPARGFLGRCSICHIFCRRQLFISDGHGFMKLILDCLIIF